MAEDRTYFRVHDGIDEHPKIAPLSDAAFRLAIETWAYCSRNRTDGRLAEGVWRKRGKPKARHELVAAGLVEQRDGYVQVHDYLDWQRSASEIDEYVEKKRRASVKGTHVRYHVGEGRPDPKCPLCADDQRPAGSSHPASQNGSHSASDNPSHPASQVAPQLESQVASQNGAQRQRQRQRQNYGTTSGGTGTEVDARDSNAPPTYPEHCPLHAHVAIPGKCPDCADARKAARHLEVVGPHNPARVPHCGQCDQTRHRETPFGVIRCPECHPQAHTTEAS